MDVESTDHSLLLLKMPTPVKALATCIILTLAFGMVGALGQIWVHDIVPTFFSNGHREGEEYPSGSHQAQMSDSARDVTSSDRGDLFSDSAVTEPEPDKSTIYQNEQFLWTLQWTHIHLFGMNLVFILIGVITLGLNVSSRARTWLVILPFSGVLLDILAMWLKGFVSPSFFWLNVLGGGIFAAVFFYVSIRAMWEMWGRPRHMYS